MKKNVFLLFLLILIFPTVVFSNDAPPTIEEKVLLKLFLSYQSALVYDEVCNGNDPKNHYDFDKKENVFLKGNEQMLVARFGGVQHVRFPDKTVYELVRKTVDLSNNLKKKIEGKIKAQSCEGEVAIQAKKSWNLFTKAHPLQIYAMADKEIIKQGGRVTSIEEIEAVTGKQPLKK